MKLKQELDQRAADYGYKEANLYLLHQLSEELPSQATFVVPKFKGISHEENYRFILLYKNDQQQTFETLYLSFCTTQNNHSSKHSLAPFATKILEEIQSFILEAYTERTMAVAFDQTIEKLIVRSTGKEDNDVIANPGGNESFSNIANDPQTISIAIGRVIASYFSEKSIIQRILAGDDITNAPFMPVLLQEMIGISDEEEFCVRSGVMYTNKRGTQIQVAPGYGELVVNSRVPFDSYFIASEQIGYADLKEKKYRMVPSHSTLELVGNKSTLKYSSSLSDTVVYRLSVIGQALEKYYGAPRDVEFVYEPRADIIYLVQARPIPKSNITTRLPSSVPPQKLEFMKKNAHKIVRGITITPAENVAKVITAKNQIITASTIEKALSIYLYELDEDLRSLVQAVLVQEEAPRAGHEAAQFNLCSIPVLVLDYSVFTQREFTSPLTTVIVIDPQRSQLIVWPCQGGESLFDSEKGILSHGLFKSSLPARQAFFTRELFNNPSSPSAQFGNTSTIGAMLEDIKLPGKAAQLHTLLREIYDSVLSHVVKKSDTLYQEFKNKKMSELVEIIEGVQSNHDNPRVHLALYFLLIKFINVNKKIAEGTQTLLQQAMLSGLELHRKIKEISDCVDTQEIQSIQQEILDLCSKFTGLIYYQGQQGSISSSLIQELNRNKDEQQARDILVKKVNQTAYKAKDLDSLLQDKERFSQLVFILKFGTLASNDQVQSEWNRFAVILSQSPAHVRALVKLLVVVERLGLSSEWLNKLFILNLEKDAIKTLEDLRRTTEQFYVEMDRLSLDKAEQMISEWTLKIHQWAEPEKFEFLLCGFQKLNFLIEMLSLNREHHEFSQIKILRLIKQLTQVIDESIKFMKGSPKYATEDTVVSRARNMVKMLPLFSQLMTKWVGYLPGNSLVDLSRDDIIGAINARLDQFFKICDNANLEAAEARRLTLPSEGFSNEFLLYRPGSDPRFKEDLFRKLMMNPSSDMTLEDLYTLLHQYIMNALAYLEPASNPKFLPKALKECAELLESTTIEGSDYKGFGSVHCSGPYYNKQGIYYDFHCSLGKHQFTIDLAYLYSNRKISFKYKLTDGGGGDEHYRYTDIEFMMKLLYQHLQKKCPSFKLIQHKIIATLQLQFEIEIAYEEFTSNIIIDLQQMILRCGLRSYGETARKGKFFLPDAYELKLADLIYCIKNLGGPALVAEIACKINDINTSLDSGETALSVAFKNKPLYLVPALLKSSQIDSNAKVDGMSIIEMILLQGNYSRPLLGALLGLAIRQSNVGLIAQILALENSSIYVEYFLEIIRAELGLLFDTKTMHPQYYACLLNSMMLICGNHDILKNVISHFKPLPKSPTLSIFSNHNQLELCEVQIVNLLVQLKHSPEDFKKIMQSPLVTNLTCSRSGFLLHFIDAPDALDIIMQSGKITDAIIKANLKRFEAKSPGYFLIESYMKRGEENSFSRGI